MPTYACKQQLYEPHPLTARPSDLIQFTFKVEWHGTEATCSKGSIGMRPRQSSLYSIGTARTQTLIFVRYLMKC